MRDHRKSVLISPAIHSSILGQNGGVSLPRLLITQVARAVTLRPPSATVLTLTPLPISRETRENTPASTTGRRGDTAQILTRHETKSSRRDGLHSYEFLLDTRIGIVLHSRVPEQGGSVKSYCAIREAELLERDRFSKRDEAAVSTHPKSRILDFATKYNTCTSTCTP